MDSIAYLQICFSALFPHTCESSNLFTLLSSILKTIKAETDIGGF